MQNKETDKVFYSSLSKDYSIVDRAKGMYVYTEDGKQYLDCAAGIAVVNIGHGVEDVINVMKEQAEKVLFVYGGTFSTEARSALASQIIELAPDGMEKVFFCSGGSEAMESVIKIARQYQIECGRPSKYKIISRWQSYHGNTIGTLSIGGRPSWRAKYEPYLLRMPHIAQCNCYRCPYGLEYPNCNIECAWELERVIKYEGPDTVAAFAIEPIIGTTAAATIPPQEYMNIIREICDKYDVLLCVDEVITGLGRTGKNFAVDHYDLKPDLIAIAKGLGSGYVPIGAVIAHEKIIKAIENGTGELTHSFTFAGNPLACATASAVLTYMEKKDLVNRSLEMGKIFLDKLKKLEELPMVGEVRGIGLLLGVEFVKDKDTKETYPAEMKISQKISEYCFSQGVIVTSGVPGSYDGISGEALQIAPPFIIEEDQMNVVVNVIRDAILEVNKTI